MKTYFTEATVLRESKIAVDHLPFVEGENVAVFVMALAKDQPKGTNSKLKDSILSYESPFDPATHGEWDALS